MQPAFRTLLINIHFAFFDLDSTLVDLEHLHFIAFKYIIAQHYSIPYSLEDYLHYSVGYKFPENVTRFLESNGVNYAPEQLQQMGNTLNILKPLLINKYPHLIKIKPCAAQLLQLLKTHQKGLALVTSSSRPTADAVLNTTGLSKFFDFIITGTDVKHGKPNPEPYLKAIEISITRKAIVFEDSQAGIVSAKEAGLPVIAIHNKGINDQAISLANLVVKSWCEIIK